MDITLHVTNKCNMKCTYCNGPKNNDTMSIEVACKSIDFAVKNTFCKDPMGVAFFGGEPLLCKNLIYDVVDYTKKEYPNRKFMFKITTNATLLDCAFEEYADRNNILLALSIDGNMEAHDKNRIDKNGFGTYSIVEETAKRLLKTKPYTPAMMTINTNTLSLYSESVKHLYSLGFRYVIVSLNYGDIWTDNDLNILKREYQKLSSFYYDMTITEENFYFSPLDGKIISHIYPEKYKHEGCALGKKHISVSPIGKIYPCVQFVECDDYLIGDIESGFDDMRREQLYIINEKEKSECKGCTIKERCVYNCGCINKQATGFIDRVAPLQCENERMVIQIADSLAKRLYKKRNAIFIQKQYNEMYPLISLIEDKAKNTVES